MRPWQDDVSYVCVHPPFETTTAERRNFLGMFMWCTLCTVVVGVSYMSCSSFVTGVCESDVR